MFLPKLKVAAALVLVVGLVGVGLGVVGPGAPAAGQAGPRSAPAAQAAGAGAGPGEQADPAPGRVPVPRVTEVKKDPTRREVQQEVDELRERLKRLEERLKQQQQQPPVRDFLGLSETGQSWAERSTLRGHPSGVWCVAFSPDGKLLATGSGGTVGNPGELRIYDAAKATGIAIVPTKRSVRWVAFSPDGKTLATAEHDDEDNLNLRDAVTGRKIRTFAVTGRKIRTFAGHASGVDAVAFSPDGKLLASAGWDKTVRLWDVATGKELRSMQGHDKEVYAVAFSPDGRVIASAGHDGTARIWSVQTGQQLRLLEGHEGVVHGVAWAPDSRVLATVGWDKTVRLWEAPSGKLISVTKGHPVQVLGVAFSPDGRTLATVSGRWGDYNYEPGPGEIRLLDPRTGKEIATLKGHTDRIFGVAFSPDGRTMATASWDKTVKLWSLGGPKAKSGKLPTPPLGTGLVPAKRPLALPVLPKVPPAPDRLDQLAQALAAADRTDEQTVEALYLATLGRMPSDAEKQFGARHLAQAKDRREAAADLLFQLTNSREFAAHLESLQKRRAAPAN